MEFLNHSPFKGMKLNFVGRVMTFSLCQTPAGIGNDSIHTTIMSLVEDSPQSRLTSIGMEFKRPGEIHIGKIRCNGAQSPKFIKRLMTPIIPHDSLFLVACIFT